MSDNDHEPDLDLSAFDETLLTVKVKQTTYSIPLDLVTPVLVKMARCITVLGEAQESYGDASSQERVEAADREMWEVLEAVMARAEPQVSDVRAVFTSQAAMRFISFLAGRLAQIAVSTTSSPLPTSTEELSASETFSEADSSTLAPVE
jgi:uncharacterized MAPEG superfamily protein